MVAGGGGVGVGVAAFIMFLAFIILAIFISFNVMVAFTIIIFVGSVTLLPKVDTDLTLIKFILSHVSEVISMISQRIFLSFCFLICLTINCVLYIVKVVIFSSVLSIILV